ncbi:pentatricopeptide repeat-containing protein At5g61800 [Macadamia integrifolia]|uniref:pentatricopeptide repeat-containing protein At5g61800 n=1 Tax=Macadamia integrifolia TaxID=60698 RepID=UPI001C4EB1D9|nr:pentatricopeptide repeat-containing protein At5g61800 [Macadamia integrifolia]
MVVSSHPALIHIRHCKTLQQLKQVHAQAITSGLISLLPSLVLTKILYTSTLFTPLPSLHYPLCIFNQIPNPSTFCYNTMIRLYTLLSSPLSALFLFVKMSRLCIPPDTHTFPFALKACARINAISLGQTLHSQTIKFGVRPDLFVQNTLIHLYSNSSLMIDAYQLFDESSSRDVVSYNTLIDGFVKAGEVGRARDIFDSMPARDAISWGTLLAGYAQMNQCKEAIELFDQMLDLGVKPDNIALVSALSACAQIGALEQGKAIHNYIDRNSDGLDNFLATALVDMYAKCGCVGIAREIFDSSPDRNLFTWNAMVIGLAMHGEGELALEYLSRMKEAGIRPDGVSFLGVLVGCSHAGLVNEARRLFNEMESIYMVRRELKHYGCMSDLLGRAGLIEETLQMIEAMPMKGDLFVWGGLLGACRLHGNVKIAEIAAKQIIELDPEDGGVYSIMANIYANAKRWEDVSRVRRLMNVKRLKKNAGCSLIQVGGMIHEFVAGERRHPQVDDIYWVLDGIESQQKLEA